MKKTTMRIPRDLAIVIGNYKPNLALSNKINDTLDYLANSGGLEKLSSKQSKGYTITRGNKITVSIAASEQSVFYCKQIGKGDFTNGAVIALADYFQILGAMIQDGTIYREMENPTTIRVNNISRKIYHQINIIGSNSFNKGLERLLKFRQKAIDKRNLNR